MAPRRLGVLATSSGVMTIFFNFDELIIALFNIPMKKQLNFKKLGQKVGAFYIMIFDE